MCGSCKGARIPGLPTVWKRISDLADNFVFKFKEGAPATGGLGFDQFEG
jgi:hypothetical protein